MSVVGIDCGTTLTKFVWKNDFGYCFGQTRTIQGRRLSAQGLLREHIFEANVIGIGDRRGLEELQINQPAGDIIQAELHIQADGTRRALEMGGIPSDEDFLLVSIGTGTSYAIARKDGSVQALPYGRALGGGFITGLGQALGLGGNFFALNRMAVGRPLDIFLSDMLPKEKINPNDANLVVSNFGKIDYVVQDHDLAATIFHCVAQNIVQDAAMYAEGFGAPRRVVYVGTTVAESEVLRNYLDEYSISPFHLYPIFPRGMIAGYVGALGALHMNEKTEEVS